MNLFSLILDRGRMLDGIQFLGQYNHDAEHSHYMFGWKTRKSLILVGIRLHKLEHSSLEDSIKNSC